jgi:transposase
MPTASKSAAKSAAPTEKTEPVKGVGVKEVAEHMGAEPRALRAFLRRRGESVGKGTRYSWPSLMHASVKKLADDWAAARGTAGHDD